MIVVVRVRQKKLTKNVNAEVSIYRGEEAINEMNKPPRDIESDGHGEQDNTAGSNKRHFACLDEK